MGCTRADPPHAALGEAIGDLPRRAFACRDPRYNPGGAASSNLLRDHEKDRAQIRLSCTAPPGGTLEDEQCGRGAGEIEEPGDEVPLERHPRPLRRARELPVADPREDRHRCERYIVLETHPQREAE